jgi:hypothetical protein
MRADTWNCRENIYYYKVLSMQGYYFAGTDVKGVQPSGKKWIADKGNTILNRGMSTAFTSTLEFCFTVL